MIKYVKYSTEIVSTNATDFKFEYAGIKINGVIYQSSIVWCRDTRFITKSYHDIAKHVYESLTHSGASLVKVSVKGYPSTAGDPNVKHYVLRIKVCYSLPDEAEDLTRNTWYVFRRYIPESTLFEISNVGLAAVDTKCPTPEPGSSFYPLGIIPNSPGPSITPIN